VEVVFHYRCGICFCHGTHYPPLGWTFVTCDSTDNLGTKEAQEEKDAVNLLDDNEALELMEFDLSVDSLDPIGGDG